MDIEEEIIAFIKRHREATWSELEKEFVTNGPHSKGKFVNHFKKLRKIGAIAKNLNDKARPVYIIPREHEEEAEKALIKESISKNRLMALNISLDTIEDSFQAMKSNIDNVLLAKTGFFTRLKLSRSEARFFRQIINRQTAKREAQDFKISLIYPEGQDPVQLTKREIAALLQILSTKSSLEKNGQILKRPKGFNLVLSYEPQSNAGKISDKQLLEDLEEDFRTWLKQFKSKEMNQELLDYADGEKKVFLDLMDQVKLDESFLKLRTYAAQFLKRFMEISTLNQEAIEDVLRKLTSIH